MARLVHKHKPEVARYLGPAFDFVVDGPFFSPGPFPRGYALPTETVEILKNSSSVDNVVILSVVDENLNVPEHDGDVGGVAFGDIVVEAVVDFIAAGEIVDAGWYPEGGLVGFEEVNEGLVTVFVLPEVEVVHASEVFGLHIVVVCQKVEVVRCLHKNTPTFLQSSFKMFMIPCVWNQRIVSLNLLLTIPTEYNSESQQLNWLIGSTQPSPIATPCSFIFVASLNVLFVMIALAKAGIQCPAKDYPVIYRGLDRRVGHSLQKLYMKLSRCDAASVAELTCAVALRLPQQLKPTLRG